MFQPFLSSKMAVLESRYKKTVTDIFRPCLTSRGVVVGVTNGRKLHSQKKLFEALSHNYVIYNELI